MPPMPPMTLEYVGMRPESTSLWRTGALLSRRWSSDWPVVASACASHSKWTARP